MPKKRKTLPEEFQHTVKNGTRKDFEDIILRCLPNATGDYYQYNAFGFNEINEEKAKWLLDYGTDINMPDRFGYTPLHHQAMCRFHDGTSPITVTAKVWQEQYQELWDYLVPGSGSCKTVQGKVIRINGRLGHELLDNGGMNWDGNFKRMTDKHAETGQLISVIKAKRGWEEELGRLCELSVLWVLQNPMPIPLDRPNYRR